MNMLNKFVSYFLSLLPWSTESSVITTVAVDDFPELCLENEVYIVDEDNPWYAVMLCPCGCSEIIRLCLQEGVSPSWRLKFNSSGLVSLSPSIWRTSGCQSHFFLKNGKIEWCDNYCE